MLAKFHGNILNLSENIAKSFRGYFFDSHCMSSSVRLCVCNFRAPYTQAIEIFGNVSTPFGTMAIY